MTLETKAALFRSLHEASSPLVLPNAWDAASAVLVADAGAAAVATTSGGMSWAMGRGDGQHLPRADMLAAVARIASAVDVPVTADLEGGYGPGPEDVAASVRGAIAAGAAGVNLEDSDARSGGLFIAAAQAERIAAARAAAREAGLPELFVNARTDVYLLRVGEPEQRLDEVLSRARAVAEAGADGLFVPGLVDLAILKTLVMLSPLPVNVMALPGGPTVAEFADVGVRRISVGTAMAQAAYTHAQQAATELLGPGTLAAVGAARDYQSLNALFTPRKA